MTVSFNLINDAWIPTLRHMGEHPKLVSLRAVLCDAPQWREIYSNSPLTTAALYRLCIAILHASIRGPKDPKQWKTLWSNKHWDIHRLSRYLDEWQSHFELFGKHAFWQVEEGVLDSDDPAMFLRMGVDRNMGTLFDHRTAANAPLLTLAESAQVLVTAQTFKPAGGRSQGGFPNLTDAPWARGVVFLVEGETLFETLLLNLVRYPLDAQSFKYQMEEEDVPVWERGNPFERNHDIPSGYLDYLTWPSRRIRLMPPIDTPDGWMVARMQIAQGLPLPKDLQDPAKRNRVIEKPKPMQAPFAPLKLDSGRALWRDSATLYNWRDKNLHRPHVCNWIAELSDPLNRILDTSRWLRLMAFGMASDKANILFTRAERLPLPLSFLNDENLVGGLSESTEMADKTGNALECALYTLAAGLTDTKYNPSPDIANPPTEVKEKLSNGKHKDDSEDDLQYEVKPQVDEKIAKIVKTWGLDAPFWDALELEFEQFIGALDKARHDSDERARVLGTWQRVLRRTAYKVIDIAQRYAGDSSRALQSGVRARHYLALQLGGILPQAHFAEQEKDR